MDRLPRDVVLIVYRLVFDYNYSRLMEQYRTVWLNRPNSDDITEIYWNEHRMSFMTSIRFVFNWRKPGYVFTEINTAYRDQVVATLPKNY